MLQAGGFRRASLTRAVLDPAEPFEMFGARQPSFVGWRRRTGDRTPSGRKARKFGRGGALFKPGWCHVKLWHAPRVCRRLGHSDLGPSLQPAAQRATAGY